MGREPAGYQDVIDSVRNGPLINYDILKNPTLTRLYNAIKFSGRTKKKLGIGIFNAVTAPAHALIRDNSTGENTLL